MRFEKKIDIEVQDAINNLMQNVNFLEEYFVRNIYKHFNYFSK